ncbi:hypothetical protein HDV62DRAFT_117797 [Trichoderma sp. SZMC 28011]
MGKTSFVFFFAWFVVGRLASDSGGGERKKKRDQGRGNAAGCVIAIGMLVWVLIGVFSFFMFKGAVSETSMLVLLVVGGDDEGTRLWFPRGEERRGPTLCRTSRWMQQRSYPRSAECWAGGRGKEERSRFDSIRVGWSERRCDAVLFIAGRRKRAAANILGLLTS